MDAPEPKLSRLIDRINHARTRKLALQICGGNTKRFYGESPSGEPLSIGELSGITSYEPTELVVTARGGTRLDELEAALAERGQCLPFEPPRFAADGTVGGMIAAGLSGPARVSVGSVRDHVLGLTLLNGRGEMLTFGGQVAKNVAGYDVSRLMAGSMGILGVICEVSLKVLPTSVASTTLHFDWDDVRTLGQLQRWAAQPLPINATSWCGGQFRIRLSGARAAVAAACDLLGGRQLPAQQAQAWWCAIRDHADPFFSLSESQLAGGEALWRISVPAATPALALCGRQFIEWNGAQRWYVTRAHATEVRRAALSAGGHATLIRGEDRTQGVFAPLNDVLMRIHRALKDAFDPERIFNPGRLYPSL